MSHAEFVQLMNYAPYSKVLQFADKPTQLDHLFEDFVEGLQCIGLGTASIGQAAVDLAADDSHPFKSVSSRLQEQSSKLYKIMEDVVEVKKWVRQLKPSLIAEC